jgi:hypothetical protein
VKPNKRLRIATRPFALIKELVDAAFDNCLSYTIPSVAVARQGWPEANNHVDPVNSGL